MFIWNDFPWTNFNELNLDWILKMIKALGLATEENAKKIGDTYNYISENLEEIVDEKLPAIISSLQSVIINVKWYGATGDGTTDDTAAIEESLSKGNILYFPEGTYRFKEINVGVPVIIFGDGEKTIFTPIHKHAGTNQGYRMFDFQNSVYLSNIQLKFDTSVVSQTGAQYYQEAAFKAVGVNHVHLENVLFDNIFDTYHLSVSPITFENREGLAVYFSNCDYVCINDCEVREFGGEELMWISRSPYYYGEGRVLIQGNYFHDRVSQLTGSAINTLGGTVIFTNNYCHNFNNLYPHLPQKAGTLFNLIGAYVNCSDNIFINCLCGNYVDFSEGYYNKVEELICCNNLFNGKASDAIHFMAKNATFTGNYIDSVLAIRAFNIDNIPPTGDPYCVNSNTLFDFDSITITNNHFHMGIMPYNDPYPSSSYSCCIGLGQHPGGQNPVYGKIVIDSNRFSRDPANITHDVIWTATMCNYVTISNNVFDAGSAGPVNSVSNTDLNYIGGTGYDTTGGVINQVNVIGNTFICDKDVNYTIISGDSAYRPRTSHMLSNNTAVTNIGFTGTVYDHIAPGSQWARAQSNNNFQISDRA